ncbi:hypothetical protein [Effusibacillus pohliae]|uniref:hypothetical protein n=1 Tax=Effusibacillus pohliae TaxID=232270 RepID=UPI00038062B4|nr:hypothetical protein [Effusibacillus pohliae]
MFSTFTLLQKIALSLSAVLLLSGSLLGYAAWQKAKEAAAADTEADAVAQQVQRLRQKVVQQVNPPDLLKLGRAIPNDWEMALFLADLTNTAKANKVVVTSLTPSGPQADQLTKNGGSAKADGSQAKGGTAAEPKQDKQGSSSAGGTPAQLRGQQVGQQTGQQQHAQLGSQGAAVGTSPPPELVGISSLEISLKAEGNPTDLVAFVDRLQQMPRFLWINDYNLDFSSTTAGSPGTGPKLAHLQLKLTIYSRAPWDAKAAASVEWPFSIAPAGNGNAFGAP